MVRATTIALTHSGKYKTLAMPDDTLQTQRAELKKLKASRTHPEYALVEILTSQGLAARAKFDKPAEDLVPEFPKTVKAK